MYEERKEKFSFKSFFLTLLLVLLFVFLMLWLFPTKSYVNEKLGGTHDLERLSVLYDEIFANNVGRMKEAAIGYYTNERMPQVVGQTKKLTLQQMYDLHLVLKMKDKNGKSCDAKKSYVEMTKFTEEYRLKVNLSCGDQEDYIIVYLGCYNYCSGGICEKQKSTPSAKTAIEEKKFAPTPTPADNKPGKPDKYYCRVVNNTYYDKNGNVVNRDEYELSCNSGPIVIRRYMYEYKLETEGSSTCTAWSSWNTNPVSPSSSVEVETRTIKELTGYKPITVQVGTRNETVVVGTKQEKKIVGYSSKLVLVGTKQVKTGTTTQKVTEKVIVGTVEKYASSNFGTTVPNNTSTTKYKVTGSTQQPTCSNCATEIIYTWDVYKVENVYDTVTSTKTVPVYKTINVYEEQQVPVYEYKTVEVKEQRTVPVYNTIQVPQYRDRVYYRSKTCTKTEGTTDIKWSYSRMDIVLIGKGYKLTGNVKQV